MRIFVSGATTTVRRLAMVPAYHRHLGHLYVPAQRNRAGTAAETRLPFGIDNGCFLGLDEKAFVRLVKRSLTYGPEWIVQPDFVAKAGMTIMSFDWWLTWWGEHGIDLADVELPLAIVGQDGMEDLDWDHWFGYARCFFIGGSTEWKLSNAAADLAIEAKRRGMWVHMGRVNSIRRLSYAWSIGCDSVDGSGYSRFSETFLPKALDHLVRLESRERVRQPMLPFATTGV